MNNAKDIVEAGCKAIIKDLARCLPLGSTAVEIYEELQSKQIERKIQRLEELYSDLAETVNAFEDKINQEYINHDDFLDVFEEATRYVIQERQEQKRRLFKNILANSILSPDCDYDRTERYFRLLDNLGLMELEVLAVLDNPEKYNKDHGEIIKAPSQSVYQMNWINVTSTIVLTQLLDLRIDQVDEAITVLFSNGLLKENSKSKQLNTNGNALYVLKNLLTAKGRDFVKYLKSE